MRIFVIRHGETEFNEKGLIQGNIDSRLTELGVKQSEMVAEELKGIDIDMVFSSTAQRTYNTARPIAETRGFPVMMVPNLREREYGIYEGKSLEETKNAHPELFSTSPRLDFNARPKDGESLQEVADRVIPFVDKLTGHFKEKNIAIVAHGIVNKIIIAHVLDDSLKRIGEYRQANACINELVLEKGKARAARLNYTDHLKGL